MILGYNKKMGPVFFIHSVSLCLFIGELRPLMLRDINEQCLLITVILLLLLLLLLLCGGDDNKCCPSFDLLVLDYLFIGLFVCYVSLSVFNAFRSESFFYCLLWWICK